MSYVKEKLDSPIVNDETSAWEEEGYKKTTKNGKDVLVKYKKVKYTKKTKVKKTEVDVPESLENTYPSLEKLAINPDAEKYLVRFFVSGGSKNLKRLNQNLSEKNKQYSGQLRRMLQDISSRGVQLSNVFKEVETEEQRKIQYRKETDVIPIVKVEFSVLIKGFYKQTAEIGIDGNKMLITGIKAPINKRKNGGKEKFWKKLFQNIRTSILSNSSGEGEFFDALLRVKKWRENPNASSENLRGNSWLYKITGKEGVFENSVDSGSKNMLDKIVRRAKLTGKIGGIK